MNLMEELKSSVNTLEEVKKLQDLVRKLELQNQQLRNKQNKVSRHSPFSNAREEIKFSANIGGVKYPNFPVSENIDDSVKETKNIGSLHVSRGQKREKMSSIDDFNLIKVNDIDMSDDESWLYSSPKGLTPEQQNESPYKWLRKDIDNLENKELQLAKKALVRKLDELAVLSPVSQNHVICGIENSTINHSPKHQVPSKKLFQSQEYSEHHVINTRTFTRSKKKHALELLECIEAIENCKDINKNDSITDDNFKKSDKSLDNQSGPHTLSDANDVQEVARMQEESLRLSSPIGTPKRQSVSSLSGRRLSASSRSSVSDLEGSELTTILGQTPKDVILQPSTSTPTSAQGDHDISNHSSPYDSPYGSNASLNSSGRAKDDNSKSNVPNLNKIQGTFKAGKNRSFGDMKDQKISHIRASISGQRQDPNLLAVSKVKRDGCSPTRRIKQPSKQILSSGPSCYEIRATHDPLPYVCRSAEASGRSIPRSGLPRPSRQSSATRSKSGIPVPSLNKKYASEDSWSEGCF